MVIQTDRLNQQADIMSSNPLRIMYIWSVFKYIQDIITHSQIGAFYIYKLRASLQQLQYRKQGETGGEKRAYRILDMRGYESWSES